MKERILQEVKEKRERYAKHFRTEQKGMAAAVYPNAVHYREDGVWKEIDNRLEAAVENGKPVYKNRASAVKVTFAGEADKDPLVTVEKDGLKVMWGLQAGQQETPETEASTADPGSMKESAAVGSTDNATGGQIPGKCSFRVLEKPEVKRYSETAEMKLRKTELQEAELLRSEMTEGKMTKSEMTESMAQEADASEPGSESAAGVVAQDAGATEPGTESAAEAAVQDAEALDDSDRRLMGVPNLTSEGMYADILPGIDLHYALQSELVKENIRIRTREAAETRLTFSFCHPGLEMRKEPDGSLGLYRSAAFPEATETTGAAEAATSKTEAEAEEAGETCGAQEPVFRFAKPYMYDEAGNSSHDVTFLMETDGEESRVTVVPDREWLLAKEREYPVVIDPMTETAKTRANIEDTYIFTGSGEPAADVYAYGSVVVGWSSTHGKIRSLLRFKDLPAIGNGSIIYAATMYLWQYGYSTFSTPTIPLMAYEVTGNWDEKSVRWANQPPVDGNVLDYKTVGQVQNGNVITITPIGFDVTRLVRQWYNTGKNYGIMVRSRYEDPAANSQKAYARFYATDAPDISSDQFPSGVFYYRNVNGLEDYQSYHEQEMGRAGTGYTNDFTGNAVWIHPDAETSGGPMQAQIRHVYNSSEAGTASRFGYGWRLSCMQELKESGIAEYPYVYIDEDGTKHYFYKDTSDGNKLKDEDGLGLTITMTSSSEYDRYRSFETKDKTKYFFGLDGYLRFIEDPDGNSLWHQYGANASGNYLGFIQDPTGGRLTVTYTDDEAKSKLASVIDAAGRSIRYSYDAQGNLSAITYPDGKQTSFTYDSAHRLLSVKNPEGNSIRYAYANDFRVPRVSRISEYGKDNTPGQEIRISYQNGNTSVFEEPGLDGELGQTADNKKTTYHFDNMGRPTDVLDSDGFANQFEYYTSGMKNHKLGKEGTVQKTVYNLLTNPVLDSSHKNNRWYMIKEDGTRSSTLNKAEGYQGTKSAKLVNSGALTGERLAHDVTLNPGTYTFSAYIKTEDMGTQAEGAEGSAACGAALRISMGNKEAAGDRAICYVTDRNVDDGWERLSLTFRLDERTAVTASAGIFGMAGTAYVSGMQLEQGTAANRLNLINNPGLEWCTNGKPDNWDYHEQDAASGMASDPEKGRCIALHGDPGVQKSCSQAVNVSGKEGEIYSLSCWVKGVGIPDKQFSVSAAVIYTDGSVKWHYFKCNPNITGWQFVSGVFRTDDGEESTDKTYRAIHIYLMHYNQTNRALYKGIQLVRDDGASYQYDGEGNLVSAVNAAEKSHFVSDKKGSLTRMGNIDGTAFEYGYDAKNHLTRAVNSEGIRYQFGYDAKGLPKSMTVEGGKHFGAVTPGRTYYIREKYSGNYLDVRNGVAENGTAVQLAMFNGGAAQKWKVIDCQNGYFVFEPQNAAGKRLDLSGNSNTDGAAIQIYSVNNTDAQKWKLHPCADGGYQISCRGTGDKRGLTNGPKNIGVGQAVQSYTLAEGNVNQSWYFEPADEGTVSEVPKDGSVYHIRVRHSGQYLDVDHAGTAEGTNVIQYYSNGQKNQKFRLRAAGEGYFYLEPLCAPGMAAAKHGIHSATGYSMLALEERKEGAANQLFRFEEIRTGNGVGYDIVCKEGTVSLDVACYSYETGAQIILTVYNSSESQVNKWWILEACSDRMESAMTYTSDGRQDCRGRYDGWPDPADGI